MVDFIQLRMDKLEKYYDKIVSADVFLKVENTSDKENGAGEAALLGIRSDQGKHKVSYHKWGKLHFSNLS